MCSRLESKRRRDFFAYIQKRVRKIQLSSFVWWKKCKNWILKEINREFFISFSPSRAYVECWLLLWFNWVWWRVGKNMQLCMQFKRKWRKFIVQSSLSVSFNILSTFIEILMTWFSQSSKLCQCSLKWWSRPFSIVQLFRTIPDLYLLSWLSLTA